MTRRKPIEIIIGWKATFGWQHYATQTWAASPKPKKLLEIDMGWVAFGTLERAIVRTPLPFDKLAILSGISPDAAGRLAEVTVMVNVYWRPDAWRNP